MGWSTLRESAEWEAYLREVETYAEEDLKEVALGWLERGGAILSWRFEQAARHAQALREGKWRGSRGLESEWSLEVPANLGELLIEVDGRLQREQALSGHGKAASSSQVSGPGVERAEDYAHVPRMDGGASTPPDVQEPLWRRWAEAHAHDSAMRIRAMSERHAREAAGLEARTLSVAASYAAGRVDAQRVLLEELQFLTSSIVAIEHDAVAQYREVDAQFARRREELMAERSLGLGDAHCPDPDAWRAELDAFVAHTLAPWATRREAGAATGRLRPEDVLYCLDEVRHSLLVLSHRVSAAYDDHLRSGVEKNDAYRRLSVEQHREHERVSMGFSHRLARCRAEYAHAQVKLEALRQEFTQLPAEFEALRVEARELHERHVSERDALRSRLDLEYGIVQAVMAPARPGAALVEGLSASGKWESVGLMECLLAEQAPETDHSAITLQALALAEGTVRTLMYVGSQEIADDVLRHADDSSRYLAKILEEGRPMTWTTLGLWLRALERGVGANEERLAAWLANRIGALRVLAKLGLAAQWFGLRDTRNQLAHAEHGIMTRDAHGRAMHELLGATLHPWLHTSTTPRTPFSVLLDTHAAWRDALLGHP